MVHHNILNYESIAETTRKIVSIFYKSGLQFQPLLSLNEEVTFLKQKEKLALFLKLESISKCNHLTLIIMLSIGIL